MFLTSGAAGGLSLRMNIHTSAPAHPANSLAALAPTHTGRAGFERVRKPVALVCVAAWVFAAFRMPVLHGGGVAVAALIGHLLVALAALGRVWSTLHIGGHKNGLLCREGPYARTRNPLYFFSWVGVTGLALLFREAWLVPLAWAGFALSFAPLIRAEERRLARLFGSAYLDYIREVPRFFPRLGRLPDSDPAAETPGKLMRIEHALADALWFFVAAAGIEILVTSGWWEKLQVVL